MRLFQILPLMLLVLTAGCGSDTPAYPTGTMSCGTATCDLAGEMCCLAQTPPQTIVCADRAGNGGSCAAGEAQFDCLSPANCAGNACCGGSQGATCAAGETCASGVAHLCATAADCPAEAPACCGIDLVLVPTGPTFQYGECATACP
jgi:hypothetical protein